MQSPSWTYIALVFWAAGLGILTVARTRSGRHVSSVIMAGYPLYFGIGAYIVPPLVPSLVTALNIVAALGLFFTVILLARHRTSRKTS